MSQHCKAQQLLGIPRLWPDPLLQETAGRLSVPQCCNVRQHGKHLLQQDRAAAGSRLVLQDSAADVK